MTVPAGVVLACDECYPRPRAAAWQLHGVDRQGLTYRAVTCEPHVELLHDLAGERGGVASLVPLSAPAPVPVAGALTPTLLR